MPTTSSGARWSPTPGSASWPSTSSRTRPGTPGENAFYVSVRGTAAAEVSAYWDALREGATILQAARAGAVVAALRHAEGPVRHHLDPGCRGRPGGRLTPDAERRPRRVPRRAAFRLARFAGQTADESALTSSCPPMPPASTPRRKKSCACTAPPSSPTRRERCTGRKSTFWWSPTCIWRRGRPTRASACSCRPTTRRRHWPSSPPWSAASIRAASWRWAIRSTIAAPPTGCCRTT